MLYCNIALLVHLLGRVVVQVPELEMLKNVQNCINIVYTLYIYLQIHI